MAKTISEKRRIFVTTEFGNITRGSNMSNKDKKKLLRRLWKQAKRDIQ